MEQGQNSSSIRGFFSEHGVQLGIIAGLSLLLMLPRILSAQYGLLDDGVTYIAGQKMVEGTWGLDWKAGSGRFRPMYWVFNAALILLFPENAAGAFSINALVLIFSNVILYGIVYILCRNKMPALFSALFFLFSGPIIETYYTISKAEHFQVLCILISIFCMMITSRKLSQPKMLGLMFASFLFISAAMLTKETSIVMVPISIGWSLVALLLRRKDPRMKEQFIPRVIYAVMTVVVAAGFWIARTVVIDSGFAENSYVGKMEISLDRLVDSAIRMTGWVIRDFPYLLLWAGVMLIIIVIFKKRNDSIIYYPDVLLWMFGWWAVFLPWGNTQEYYLLPFAVGSAVLTGILFWELYSNGHKYFSKVPLIRLLVISVGAVFFLITILHNYTSARIQLIVDRENEKMLRLLSESVPQNGYVFLGFPGDIEYADEMSIHLREFYDRSDLTVDEFNFQIPSQMQDSFEYYVPVPTLKNRVRLSVRVGVGDMTSIGMEMDDFFSDSMDQIYSSKSAFRTFHVDIFQMACLVFPQKAYCDSGDPVLDRRIFLYGWDVNRISD